MVTPTGRNTWLMRWRTSILTGGYVTNLGMNTRPLSVRLGNLTYTTYTVSMGSQLERSKRVLQEGVCTQLL